MMSLSDIFYIMELFFKTIIRLQAGGYGLDNVEFDYFSLFKI